MLNMTPNPHRRSGNDSTGFFSLPKEIRIEIYRRVLNVPQTFFLFQDTGARVEMFAPGHTHWLEFLFANKQLHAEGSVELYGSNRFNLVNTMQHQHRLIKSFLDTVGSVNANALSHICISFPAAEHMDGQPGNIVLRTDDLLSLKLIRDKCTNLTTLELFVHGNNSNALTKTQEDDQQFTRDALLQMNDELTTIPSLTRVIVRMYSDTPTSLAMETMQGFGWLVVQGDQEP